MIKINGAEMSYLVLLIEDSIDDAFFIKDAAGESDGYFIVEHVWRLSAALELLNAEGPKRFDAIILDIGLPDTKGLSGVEALKEFNIPIIVHSGLQDAKLAEQAIEMGAQDYLIKTAITTEVFIRVLKYSMKRHNNSRIERLEDQVDVLRGAVESLRNEACDGG